MWEALRVFGTSKQTGSGGSGMALPYFPITAARLYADIVRWTRKANEVDPR